MIPMVLSWFKFWQFSQNLSCLEASRVFGYKFLQASLTFASKAEANLRETPLGPSAIKQFLE